MPSIESSGYPLVFRIADDPSAVSAGPSGARTCFLHAAMRGTHRSEIGVSLNGAELAI